MNTAEWGETSFIGIDLAWSPRNVSGGAVIRAGSLVEWRSDLGSVDEIGRFIGRHLSTRCGTIVAVVAPLRMPKVAGSRPCERTLNSDWGRFEAGAHPANRRLLARDGVVRGEALVELLEKRHRFTETSTVPRRTQERLVGDWR